jgi:Arc/MetJ-type ribon-helix-helix transcriptional regulator
VIVSSWADHTKQEIAAYAGLEREKRASVTKIPRKAYAISLYMKISYDSIVHVSPPHTMTTVSVPLTDDLLKAIQHLIDQGIAANKADAIRKALKKYIEDKEVEEILQASKEPSLDGDLNELMKKFS